MKHRKLRIACLVMAGSMATSLGCGSKPVTPPPKPATAPVPVVADSEKHTVKPDGGFVADEKTAIKIAVAIWESIYGEEKIAGEKPYRASLGQSGVWTVEGSLPEGSKGGVAVAEIAKDDARILRVSHGK